MATSKLYYIEFWYLELGCNEEVAAIHGDHNTDSTVFGGNYMYMYSHCFASIKFCILVPTHNKFTINSTHQSSHNLFSYLLPPPVVSSAFWPQLHHSVWRELSHWEEGEHTHHGGHWSSRQLHEQLPQLKGEEERGGRAGGGEREREKEIE